MRLACALALLAAGCGRHVPPRPTPIELVAGPAGGTASPYFIAFEDKQDGTGALINFMLRAERDGAHAASDLAIFITGHDGDRPVTCRRDVAVGPEPPVAPAADVYPRLVTKEVTDYVYQCTNTPVTVTHTVTTYKQQYNAVTKTTFKIPEQKEVTETVNEKSCETVPRTQVATRYQDEIEASFTPPTLAGLRPTYTKLELHLGPPLCAPAPVTAGKPPHRIEGTVYRN